MSEYPVSVSVDAWALTVGQLAAQVMGWRESPALAIRSLALLRSTLVDDGELLCLAIEASIGGAR